MGALSPLYQSSASSIRAKAGSFVLNADGGGTVAFNKPGEVGARGSWALSGTATGGAPGDCTIDGVAATFGSEDNGGNVVVNPGALDGAGADGNVFLCNTRGCVVVGPTSAPGSTLHTKQHVFDSPATIIEAAQFGTGNLLDLNSHSSSGGDLGMITAAGEIIGQSIGAFDLAGAAGTLVTQDGVNNLLQSATGLTWDGGELVIPYSANAHKLSIGTQFRVEMDGSGLARLWSNQFQLTGVRHDSAITGMIAFNFASGLANPAASCQVTIRPTASHTGLRIISNVVPGPYIECRDSADANAFSVDASGNVHLRNDAYLRLDTPATGYLQMGISGGHWLITTNNAAPDLRVWTSGGDIELKTSSGGKVVVNNNAVEVDMNATAGNTRLSVWDVDNAALERVSVGAADSGGAGFKVLRIPN